MESKKMIRFLTQILTEILESPNETSIMEVFQRIAPFPKLKTLRQGLQVFMRVHLKNTSSKLNKSTQLMRYCSFEYLKSSSMSVSDTDSGNIQLRNSSKNSSCDIVGFIIPNKKKDNTVISRERVFLCIFLKEINLSLDSAFILE